ncbi:hypothetical protein JCM19992_29810 [Thermostilla marina]
MMRSFLLACGLFIIFVGAQCFAVDRFVLKDSAPDAVKQAAQQGEGKAVLVPNDWVPWSLLSTGTILSLFALTGENKG